MVDENIFEIKKGQILAKGNVRGPFAMSHETGNPHMWHLDQDPYNRNGFKGEPKCQTATYIQNGFPDKARPKSLNELDQPNGIIRNHHQGRLPPRPLGPNQSRASRAARSNQKNRAQGHRPHALRHFGQYRSSGCSTTQDDFVYLSPNKPPQTGFSRNKTLLEETEDGDDFDDASSEGDALNGRVRRFSESSEGFGRKCRECMTRVPYATLIATLMCCVGVGVFCGTMYRGTTLTLRMFEEVFKLHIKWVEPVQLTFMVVGAGMGGLGLMILFVGCLSTGATRNKVYRTWRGRVGGRISCAIFMGITYLLSLAWLLMFAALIIVTLFYTLAWFQCQNIPQNVCIDYNQFGFLFPEGTLEEDKRVCTGERKLFCKDYVNNAEIMFILASVSAFLVILSLVHYLMCLAANYAHIKDQEKFMDLQEIQFLQESEMSTLPKDRF